MRALSHIPLEVAGHVEAATEAIDALKGLLCAPERTGLLPDHAAALILTARETRGLTRLLGGISESLQASSKTLRGA